MPARSAPTDRAWKRWATLLGFALGGFFDGILFHQILQWHHLLSLVEGVGDLRAQVVWDGYFHLLMYLVAGVAVWGLWRGRDGLCEGWGRGLVGALLLGFGLWQVVDVVVFHWIAGIHRLRLDSPNPLAWDMAWVAALGLVPLSAGWWLLRRGPREAGGRPRGSTLAVLLAGLVTAGMGAWAMQPPSGQRFTTVVFAPGVTQAQAVAAVIAADARLVWTDPTMAVVVVDVPRGRRMSFYRRGALLVGGSGAAGCLGWSKA